MMIRSRTNDLRRAQLRQLLASGRCLKVMEVHDPISAIVVENATHERLAGGAREEFDGFWSSSLTDSTLRGLPDIEVLDLKARLTAINDIFAVTSKPLIMDGDTGGQVEHFERYVQDMERAGVSAVIIEDKTGLKRNSLLGTSVPQQSADPAEFAEKIKRGKAAQRTDDFLIFSRIESLILGLGAADALRRADRYVDAGADGVMIHSRQAEPTEVIAFAGEFRRRHATVPLICVPTSYSTVPVSQLADAGFNIVIYANHMLRAALQAMREVSTEILRNGRTAEVESRCVKISELLHLSPVEPAQV